MEGIGVWERGDGCLGWVCGVVGLEICGLPYRLGEGKALSD